MWNRAAPSSCAAVVSDMSHSVVTTPERSKLMMRVRRAGTAAELEVRRILRSAGVRCSLNTRALPGSPDFASRPEKWAIFVHGCFWHSHPKCRRATVPKRNTEFWRAKFADNRARDRRKVRELHRLGFDVLTVWECELESPARAAPTLLHFLRRVGRPRAITERPTRPGATGKQDAGRQHFGFAGSSRVWRVVSLQSGVEVRSFLTVTRDQRSQDSESAFDQSYLRTRQRLEAPPGPSVRCVDLFAGCGGLSLGAREACTAMSRQFEAVLAIEVEPASLAVYEANFHPAHALSCGIEDVFNGRVCSRPTATELRVLDALGPIEVLLAGPPCQGHSNLNNHTRRTDHRNELYERVARFVELAEPKHVLIENVPALVHSHDRVYHKTLEVLSRRGYHVDAGVLDLSELGVPQRRKRHVVVASRTTTVSVRSVLAQHRVRQPRTVSWAISDLFTPSEADVLDAPSEHSPANRRRMKYLLRYDLYDLPNWLRPRCHRDGEHSYKSMYGRMRLSAPAQTITGGFGSPGQGRFIHPTQPRTITPHEAARLQFFPDWFDFSKAGSRGSLARMIGNAVPMKLAYVFCLELLA